MTEPIPLFKVFMDPAINLTPILTSGQITQGKQVEKFESELKAWFQYPYILTVNSATSGLTLALRLLNLPPGSEILSTPLTCFATNAAILANNHTIKWIDIDPTTCNISLQDLEKKITEKTKAIMLVHWGGYPVDLNKLHSIKEQAEARYNHSISIIEDCAHAFGATYNNKPIGTHGNICVFSLQAIKHLTTGDGGLIFLPNKELYDRAKLLRWYGISREHKTTNKDFRLEEDITEWGYKFHMNDIAASIGLSNLPFISKNLDIMKSNTTHFRNSLSAIPGLELLENKDDRQSANWLFTIKIKNKHDFIPYMKNKNITVSQVHNRNDIHSCVKNFQSILPLLDELEKEIICIPSGWWLTDEDKQHIIISIKAWCELEEYISTLKIRILKSSDYYKGYLTLLSQLNNHIEPFTAVQFHENLQKILKQGSIIAVIEDKGSIIATAKLFIEEKFYSAHAHIEDVVVHEQYRHRGLGTKLLQFLQYYCEKCYKISLVSKPELHMFYTNNGFTLSGNHYVKFLN